VPAARGRFKFFDAGQNLIRLTVASARGENIAVTQEIGRESGPRRCQRVSESPDACAGIEDLCASGDGGGLRVTDHTTGNQ